MVRLMELLSGWVAMNTTSVGPLVGKRREWNWLSSWVCCQFGDHWSKPDSSLSLQRNEKFCWANTPSVLEIYDPARSPIVDDHCHKLVYKLSPSVNKNEPTYQLPEINSILCRVYPSESNQGTITIVLKWGHTTTPNSLRVCNSIPESSQWESGGSLWFSGALLFTSTSPLGGSSLFIYLGFTLEPKSTKKQRTK